MKQIKKTTTNNEDIKIKKEESSLKKFIERPVPSSQEVEQFEKRLEEEIREEEIKESLNEIYKDSDGKMVDVKKLEVKKSRGFLFRLAGFIIIAGLAGCAMYAMYYYIFLSPRLGSSPVELTIEADKEILAGEEFFYVVKYKNQDNVEMKNLEIKLTYPENFIFLDSEPLATLRNDTWKFDNLGAHRSDIIKIKGKLIGEVDTSSIVLADMIYTPTNFSSEFRKSASMETKISDTGVELSIINASSALISEKNEIVIKYKAGKNNFLNNFLLTIEHPENMEFLKSESEEVESEEQELKPKQIKLNSWLVENISEEEQELKINFKIKEKQSAEQSLILKFEHMVSSEKGDEYYLFHEATINYEIIKSDLNLNLIINGSQADQGVDFGQTLHYSIGYANRGEVEMEDILIMAVLESDFLDWKTLDDENNGKVEDNTISWSKLEIPGLASLEKNKEGVIDFSIKLKPFEKIDLGKNYQIKSYIQFSIGGREVGEGEGEDSQSNIIINKINSDINLTEVIRYFNDDEIAVGTGPLPPKVGETTSLKVYWTINNNLHELNDLEIKVKLPNYVSWDNKNRASVGALEYDSQNHLVKWQIGRLPTTVYRADAEFNISITPTEADRNKILVLLPGTIISAVDKETKAEINKTLKTKTTKLEDENIANNDGVVD